MPNWLDELAPALQQLRAADSYRQRRTLASAQGPSVHMDGRELLNFSSNDYLGLANHPRVVEAFCASAAEHGVGAGASHLVVGHHQSHQQLEQRLAEVTGRDRALVFSSGYMANLGVLQVLLGKGDTVFQDKLNHASLIDAGLACRAQQLRYRHRDMTHLEALLKKPRAGRALIVTDGVFSMDGDIAPLAKIAELADRHAAVVMVDDAHGFGVLGSSGAGSAEHAGLGQSQLPVLMGTLGKALGSAGAFVAGSDALIETLVQHARNYIYTTAIPPACAAAALAALELNAAEPARRAQLRRLIEHFQAGCEQRGIPLRSEPAHNETSHNETSHDENAGHDESASGMRLSAAPRIAQAKFATPIQPIIVGGNKAALTLAAYLYRHDILAVAIRPPTVPQGSARLRISFSAAHSIAQVDYLLDTLANGCRAQGLLQ